MVMKVSYFLIPYDSQVWLIDDGCGRIRWIARSPTVLFQIMGLLTVPRRARPGMQRSYQFTIIQTLHESVPEIQQSAFGTSSKSLLTSPNRIILSLTFVSRAEEIITERRHEPEAQATCSHILYSLHGNCKISASRITNLPVEDKIHESFGGVVKDDS